MDNIVFYFSGTGNCLKAAKDISKELNNCEIASMGKLYNLAKKYDSIGFVYPAYFWGLPKKVIEFVENINLENNKQAYFYAVTTYGGSAGNALYQLYDKNSTQKRRRYTHPEISYTDLYEYNK
jgi:flavodoxin